MRIGVLSNRKAGGSGARVTRVLEHLARYPEIVHVDSRTSLEAPLAIHELAEAGIDILVINGGDGTLQRSLTEVLGPSSPFSTPPRIGILRTGRTSMSAADIGSHADPLVAIDRLVERVRSGRLAEAHVDRAVLRMVIEEEGIDHYGTFLGFGVIQRATMLTHRVFPEGRAQGIFGSSLVTLGLMARATMGGRDSILAADRMAIALDGERLEQDAWQLVLATTLGSFFLGMKPFWSDGPGGIRFTAIGDGGLRNPFNIARIVRGRAPRARRGGPVYESRNVERAEIDLDCGLAFDGEIFEPRPGRRVRLLADHRLRFLSLR